LNKPNPEQGEQAVIGQHVDALMSKLEASSSIRIFGEGSVPGKKQRFTGPSKKRLPMLANMADTDEAKVTLHDLSDAVEVRIIDKGKGFVRDSGAKGVGLYSMEERARAVGG
jgi:hypothetical protein